MKGDSLRNANLIAEALASPEVEDRRQATSLLAHLELDAALPLIVRALGDDDWRVRKEASAAARAFADERALIQELVKLLGPGDNVGLRNAVVEVLAAAGPIATPALAISLGTLDADGRKLAVEALGRSRDSGALESLTSVASDPDENVRQAAIEAVATLAPVAPERAAAVLLGALDAGDPVVRLAALEGLTGLGHKVPWATLGPLVADPRLRAVALSAASLSDAPEAAGAVVRALADARGAAFAHALTAGERLADGPLRAQVAEALAAAGAELGDRLVAAAEARDADPGQRATALMLAALARAPGALDVASASLSEEVLADRALDALRALGLGALPALVAKLASPSVAAGARADLLDAVAAMALEQDPTRVPWTELLAAVRTAAGDGDRRLATVALSALARVGPSDDLELCARATLSRDRGQARTAESALSRLAARLPGAARGFYEAHHGDASLALAMATILGALSESGAAQPSDMTWLVQAATAGSPDARRAAVAAAAQVGGPAAMEALSFALADEVPEVQLAAARGLGHLCATATVVRAGPRDTIPDLLPNSSRRPGEILQLVERSGAPELVAATVRAIGDGIAALDGEPDQDLLYALASFARHAASPVALASVDALAQAPDSSQSALAIAAGLEHKDDGVVSAAVLKLSSRTHGWETIGQALGHPSVSVRVLAAEALADHSSPEVRDLLQRRAAVETNADVRTALEIGLARRDGSR